MPDSLVAPQLGASFGETIHLPCTNGLKLPTSSIQCLLSPGFLFCAQH